MWSPEVSNFDFLGQNGPKRAILAEMENLIIFTGGESF